MRTQIVRTMKLGDAGRFSCTWTNSKSLLEELISTYSRQSPAPTSAPPLQASQSQSPPPLLMFPWMGLNKDDILSYLFFNPVDREFRVVAKHKNIPDSARLTFSSKGWVTFLNPLDGAQYMWDPLSEVQKDVLRLPSTGTLPCVVDIRFVRRNGSPTTTIRDIAYSYGHNFRGKTELNSWWMVIKDGCFSSAPGDDNHCIALSYCGLTPELHYSEIGGTAWKALDGPLGPYAQVLASSKKDKLFFALNLPGEIEAWDLSDLSNIKRTLVTEAHRFCLLGDDTMLKDTDLNGQTYYKKECDYMVESSGDLLLVTKYLHSYSGYDTPNRTKGFVVHRLNFGLRKWEPINCLSGYAIFVGQKGESFSLRASDHYGLEENAIYFAPDDRFGDGGQDSGVFYLGDKKIDRYDDQIARYHRPTDSTSRAPFWVAPPHHSPSP